MLDNSLEARLSGGHPNSLGNTVQIVNEILNDKSLLPKLYACYQSEDAVVRLRVSNAMKRICKEKPQWIAEYLDGLLHDISTINQASTKWTLATLFLLLDTHMSPAQRQSAIRIMKQNLHYSDWIVQNTTAESLAHFAKQDDELRTWLLRELKKLQNSSYNSVKRRATKLIDALTI